MVTHFREFFFRLRDKMFFVNSLAIFNKKDKSVYKYITKVNELHTFVSSIYKMRSVRVILISY